MQNLLENLPTVQKTSAETSIKGAVFFQARVSDLILHLFRKNPLVENCSISARYKKTQKEGHRRKHKKNEDSNKEKILEYLENAHWLL